MDFANTSGIKSPFSPRVKQSNTGRRTGGLGKKTKFSEEYNNKNGEVVYKAPNFTIETYGAPLPVLVTEALTFGGEVCVRMWECGWCGVVVGRRVVVWDPVAPPARELTLPQTDLAHKADLVVIFYEQDAQMPSCIGVSPEGVVRYWPSIGQEAVFSDVTLELAGQECDTVTEPTSEGLLLATTTCTLVILKQNIVGGVGSVSWRVLRPPSGWLGGLGRRVSTLFFPTTPASPTNHDTKLLGVEVVREGPLVEEEEGAGCVALVGWPTLQVWTHEVHHHDLRQYLLHHPQLAHHAEMGGVSGVRAGRVGEDIILLLATHAPRTPDHRYIIAVISVSAPSAPRVVAVVPLRGWPVSPPPLLDPLSLQHILLYHNNYIGVCSLTSEGLSPCEGIEVGGIVAVKGGTLVTSTHSLCRLILPPPPSLHRSLDQSQTWNANDSYRGTLALYEIDPAEVEKTCVDGVGKLKTAFLYHVRGDTRAGLLLNELFPFTNTGDGSEVDGPLEGTVVAVAYSILDDRPLGDPRWKCAEGEDSGIPVGGSYSLQVSEQVQDKRRVLGLYLQFLNQTGLWQRLQNVSRDGGGVIPARSVVRCVCELAAIGGVLANSEGELLERAVRLTTSHTLQHALTHLSKVPELLEAVCKVGCSVADSRTGASLAITAMDLITEALSEMWSSRGEPVESPSQVLYPVLVAAGELHDTVLKELVRPSSSVDASVSMEASEAASRLADGVLTEGAHLTHAHSHNYTTLTRLIITPYVEIGKEERALVLMEKFLQHDMYVRLCVDRGWMDRLDKYVKEHPDQGVMEMSVQYLSSTPLGRRRLAEWGVGDAGGAGGTGWVHRGGQRALTHLVRGDRGGAATTLLEVAHHETDSLNRLTVIASLAKLCALSSGLDDKVESSERILEVCDHISALPRDIRRRHGGDEDCPVYSPDHLVQMYVECDGPLTEYDYKKALDLSLLVQDMALREQLQLQVWCASIVRNKWNIPAEEAQNHVFNKLLDLVIVMGDGGVSIPPLVALEGEEALRDLVEDNDSLYALRYWYHAIVHHQH